MDKRKTSRCTFAHITWLHRQQSAWIDLAFLLFLEKFIRDSENHKISTSYGLSLLAIKEFIIDILNFQDLLSMGQKCKFISHASPVCPSYVTYVLSSLFGDLVVNFKHIFLAINTNIIKNWFFLKKICHWSKKFVYTDLTLQLYFLKYKIACTFIIN